MIAALKSWISWVCIPIIILLGSSDGPYDVTLSIKLNFHILKFQEQEKNLQ